MLSPFMCLHVGNSQALFHTLCGCASLLNAFVICALALTNGIIGENRNRIEYDLHSKVLDQLYGDGVTDIIGKAIKIYYGV